MIKLKYSHVICTEASTTVGIKSFRTKHMVCTSEPKQSFICWACGIHLLIF